MTKGSGVTTVILTLLNLIEVMLVVGVLRGNRGYELEKVL